VRLKRKDVAMREEKRGPGGKDGNKEGYYVEDAWGVGVGVGVWVVQGVGVLVGGTVVWHAMAAGALEHWSVNRPGNHLPPVTRGAIRTSYVQETLKIPSFLLLW
jgi:hypothetical protein